MDIYSYLNSPDVAEHCRKLNYQFNALESAFIINDCRHISIEEKHRLYREIMETMPDMEIPNPRVFYEEKPDLSLFHQLEKLMRTEQQILRRMKDGKEGWFYTFYAVFYASDSSDLQGCYSTYEKAVEATCEYAEWFSGDKSFVIEQRTLDSDSKVSVFLNEQYEICYILPQTNAEPYSNFLYELWVYIPTPFKKGDLVSGVSWSFQYPICRSDEPMVLREICYWERDTEWIERRKKEADSSDMTAWGYWLDRDGSVYDECIHSYYNLTYFKGETEPTLRSGCRGKDYRLLKTIGAFLKQEINLHMLLIANDAIRAERMWNSAFPGWDYVNEEYDKAGITDIREKRDLLRKYEEERARKAKNSDDSVE